MSHRNSRPLRHLTDHGGAYSVPNDAVYRSGVRISRLLCAVAEKKKSLRLMHIAGYLCDSFPKIRSRVFVVSHGLSILCDLLQ